MKKEKLSQEPKTVLFYLINEYHDIQNFYHF